ncbi:helix-turn-helix domain-containing protein [Streptomyces mirabilis]|nr:helix-turn-helix domain-containing protein [Streptomyces mirabilis]
MFAARCRDSAHRRRIADAAASYAARAWGLAGEYRATPSSSCRRIRTRTRPPAPWPTTCRGSWTTRSPSAPRRAAPGLDAIVEAHHDAVRCLDVSARARPRRRRRVPGELGVYGLLFHQAGREELHRFVRRTIGPVLDYDTQRGGELTRTLLAFFACDTGLGRTAAELYIHVNTLYQRIDRITSLLGPQWRHGDQVLQVHLALKVHLVLSAA